MDNIDLSIFRRENPQNLSPYTSIDLDAIRNAVPQYIYLDADQETQDRGRLAKSFSNIGLVYLTGSTLGAVHGFSNTLKILNRNDPLWKTQVLNHVFKKSCWYGLPLGVLSTMYSIFAFSVNKIRGGEDDDWNTLAGTTLAGAFYKCTGGLRNTARGALVGAIFGGIIILVPMSLNTKNYFFKEKNKYNI